MCMRLEAHLPHERDRHSLMNEIQWTKAKVRVYSDSVLCLEQMYGNRDAILRWEGRVEEWRMCVSCGELLGIVGQAIELEWTILPGFRYCRFFTKSRMTCESETLNLHNSQTGSSSCQCSTTSFGQEKETMEFVFRIQDKSRNTRRNFRRDTGRFSGPGDENKWYGTLLFSPKGKWDSTATS